MFATIIGLGIYLLALVLWVRHRNRKILSAVRQTCCPCCGSGLAWVEATDLRPIRARIRPASGDWFPELSTLQCRCGQELKVYSRSSLRGLKVSVDRSPWTR
jgi:hypothetical protein